VSNQQRDLQYLEVLSEMYPTIGEASTEIINLQSILNLPKGTEHFMSDIHGEYDAFSHVLKNGSGAVRKKIDDVFGHTLGTAEKSALATLIYYPKEKMELVKQEESDMTNWYKVTLYRLVEVCKITSSKYTKSKVRKALPKDYAYVIEELITEKSEVLNKEAYYDSIVNTIVEIGRAEDFIVAMCNLIQRLVIDHLHVIGDIYDRGSGAHFIMDCLEEYHSLDIQWGNHDVVWMGAATGQMACIACAIRNTIRYGNLDLLEDGYGINMLPLASFAMSTYADDDCVCFEIKDKSGNCGDNETIMNMKMQKAIAVIKFKLEGQLIEKYPEFGMENRRLLHRIDPQKGTVTIDGKEYQMKDVHFPTVDWAHPYELTEQEQEVMERLQSSFRHCEKLQRHMKLLLKKGNLYKVFNGNLLYHGCVPMNADGTLKEVTLFGKSYKGKALFDVLEAYVRKAYFSLDQEEQKRGADMLWYLWCAPDSPLYGRDKMATFERYFLTDKEAQKEEKNVYYQLIDDPKVVDAILADFGLHGEQKHIINGHVPVQRVSGESPVRAGGKVFIIDGGFSKVYRSKTGIAGYTLIYNSYGLTLAAHEPFVSAEEAVKRGIDIVSKRETVELSQQRLLVGDTDAGKKIKEKIEKLKELIRAYRLGELTEKGK
jgi:fructose-1,6-bisphosphatase III